MSQDKKKRRVAKAAIEFIIPDTIIGVGTGSTVNYFIEELALIKHKIKGVVSSSQATTKLLNQYEIPVIPLNSVNELLIYIDGADEATKHGYLIKGGGGALTQEKVIASAAKQFICIIDDSKLVNMLGAFPLPVEVIPMAQSYVARQIVALGGQPILREQFKTDYNNNILDIHNLMVDNVIKMEEQINQISGVVSHGIFAKRSADIILVADNQTIQYLGESIGGIKK